MRARWRPAMWATSGITYFNIEDLAPRELAVVEAAARQLEQEGA